MYDQTRSAATANTSRQHQKRNRRKMRFTETTRSVCGSLSHLRNYGASFEPGRVQPNLSQFANLSTVVCSLCSAALGPVTKTDGWLKALAVK